MVFIIVSFEKIYKAYLFYLILHTFTSIYPHNQFTMELHSHNRHHKWKISQTFILMEKTSDKQKGEWPFPISYN